MSTEIAKNIDMLWDPAGFEHGQRVAKMFASSELVPPHMRGKLADVTIALLMAQRLSEDPLVIMQSIYIVSGRAGWAATYVIARANRAGVFAGRINWRVEGKGAGLSVTAFAKLREGGEDVAYTVSLEMAAAEGWTKNPKYKSMPELMLRYRSAVALVRLFCPEVMLGYSTREEIEDEPVNNVVHSAPRSSLGIIDYPENPPRIVDAQATTIAETPSAPEPVPVPEKVEVGRARSKLPLDERPEAPDSAEAPY